MKRIHRLLLGFCCIAMSLFGVSSFASAETFEGFLPNPNRVLAGLDSFGGYGAQSAKFEAELAYARSMGACEPLLSAQLTSESNGFRMANLTKSGVAGGETGVSGERIA